MAAPAGDSTYSYSRTTFESSTEASTAASLRNISANSGSSSRLRGRYLIATRGPEASCLASTTSPNPPEPGAFSSVYPGTSHSAMRICLPSRQSGLRAPASRSAEPRIGGRPASDRQQLTLTWVVSLSVLGPRTCKVTVCDAVPWPSPSTATVTNTACCPLVTDWFCGCGACTCGWNTH